MNGPASPTPSLRSATAYLAAGVGSGFVAGLVVGGVGGRLAMLLLRLTSDPALHGVQTDDQFTIGVISGDTFFLLVATALLGALGGVVYVVARAWFSPRVRPWVSAVFFGSIGAASAIRPHGVDFTLLSPIPLAVGLFVVLPVAYGVALVRLTERLLRHGTMERTGPMVAGLVPMLPLAAAGGIGALVMLGALGVWRITRSAPEIASAWTSTPVLWLGRALLLAVTLRFLAEAVADAAEVLS